MGMTRAQPPAALCLVVGTSRRLFPKKFSVRARCCPDTVFEQVAPARTTSRAGPTRCHTSSSQPRCVRTTGGATSPQGAPPQRAASEATGRPRFRRHARQWSVDPGGSASSPSRRTPSTPAPASARLVASPPASTAPVLRWAAGFLAGLSATPGGLKPGGRRPRPRGGRRLRRRGSSGAPGATSPSPARRRGETPWGCSGGESRRPAPGRGA